MKALPVAAVLFALSTGLAGAAEPIEGKWRVSNGETVGVSSCGAGYCLVAETGKYKGKRIGRVSGSGRSYTGEVTDPTTDKTYAGTATIDGASLKLTGCAFKVFCRSQTWTKI